MARKPNPQPHPVADDSNNKAITASIEAADQRTLMLTAIDQTYGAGLPYSRDRVIAEATFFINQGSESFFEAGKRLILLKEHEGHGGFMKAVEAIGIHDRAANRLMMVAAKFSNSTTLSNLNRSKLLELAVLDDDQIAELDQGGTVAGLQVDDIDRMSVRELKAALRAEKEEHTATREQVASKNQKIDELDKKLSKKSRQPWDQTVIDALSAFDAGKEVTLEFLVDYEAALAGLAEMLDNENTPNEQRESAARSLVNEVNKIYAITTRLVELCNERVSIYIVQ